MSEIHSAKELNDVGDAMLDIAKHNTHFDDCGCKTKRATEIIGRLAIAVEIGLKVSYDSGLDDSDLVIKKLKKAISEARTFFGGEEMSGDMNLENAREIYRRYAVDALSTSPLSFHEAKGFFAGLRSVKRELGTAKALIGRLVKSCDKALEERILGHPQVEAGAMEDFEVALSEARAWLDKSHTASKDALKGER
jgi:hypothetical protein